MAYEIGARVRLPVTVRDAAGALSAATMALTITKPDLTAGSHLGIVNDSLGQYHADTDATAAGVHQWRYAASGTVVGVYTGQFFVRLPGPRIMSLQEAKDHLNKDQAVTTDDEEVRGWIDATRFVIEGIVGPVVPQTITDEIHNGGSKRIFLKSGPVLGIDSITEAWTPGDIRTVTAEAANLTGLTNDQYAVDGRAVSRRSFGYPQRWAYGMGNIRVTYRVGYTVIQDNHRAAAMELLTHFWRQSQLAAGTRRANPDSADVIAMSHGVPNRVRELLGKRRAPLLGR